MMKTKSVINTSLVMALFACPILSNAQKYVVVSNKEIDQLNENQIKAIYLKKLTGLEGKNGQLISLVPINLDPHSSIRIQFTKAFIKMSYRRLKSYWSKQHYLGHRPPIKVNSQQSMLALLEKVNGGIAYVDQLTWKENKANYPSIHVVYTWND